MMNKTKFSVIIPAAGKATRMRPLSNTLSKAMIPINGKPIISYILDHLFEIGDPQEIVIVQNESGDIENFVKITYSELYKNGTIKFAVQKYPDGPLQAVWFGADQLENKEVPITVWLGDTICLEHDFDLTESFLATSFVTDYQRWCMVDQNLTFYDKPQNKPPTSEALIGIYHFADPYSFWQVLEQSKMKPQVNNEYQISTLLSTWLIYGDGDPKFNFQLNNTHHWYDCGELQTYYESKARLLNRSARSFNRITVDTFLGTVTKTSDDLDKTNKILDEKNWFLSLPPKSALFCPRIIEGDSDELVMSQEPGTPLNEMWLYENLRLDIWVHILEKILRIHNEIFLREQVNTWNNLSPEIKKVAMTEMYLTKNLKRLEKYQEWSDYHLVYEFVKFVGNDLINTPPMWTPFLHGDSHLGNILFEPIQGTLKFVDPRGSFGGIGGTQGDMRYDMAKIAQDFYMNYADILAGNYIIEQDILADTILSENVVFHRDIKLSHEICKYLKGQFVKYGYDYRQIFDLSTVLMITCIPFHADDPERQRAFWIHSVNKIKSSHFMNLYNKPNK